MTLTIVDEINRELMKLGSKVLTMDPDKQKEAFSILKSLNSGNTKIIIYKNEDILDGIGRKFEENKNAFIVVIGFSITPGEKICGIASRYGFPKDRIRRHLDDSSIKSFKFDSVANPNCIGVIIGPVHHKMIGMGDENSPIQQIRALNKNVALCKNGDSDELKMTNNSVDKAFKELSTIIMMDE